MQAAVWMFGGFMKFSHDGEAFAASGNATEGVPYSALRNWTGVPYSAGRKFRKYVWLCLSERLRDSSESS
jgi:hypothetical protein